MMSHGDILRVFHVQFMCSSCAPWGEHHWDEQRLHLLHRQRWPDPGSEEATQANYWEGALKDSKLSARLRTFSGKLRNMKEEAEQSNQIRGEHSAANAGLTMVDYWICYWKCCQGKPLDGIIIETTGLADPAPVAQTFFADEFVQSSDRSSFTSAIDIWMTWSSEEIAARCY